MSKKGFKKEFGKTDSDMINREAVTENDSCENSLENSGVGGVTESTAATADSVDKKMSEITVKFGLKSFLTVVGILLAVVITVGILTYVIPAGRFDLDEQGKIIFGSYHLVENTTRLPVWRWLTAPFEALVIGEGNMSIIQVIALLLILGGTFKVLQESGGLTSLVRILIEKLYKKRYLAIWVITFVLMFLSAVFGLQEQFLILYPLFYMLCLAMNWSNFTAISFILITSGVGFTTAITNPFTIGTAAINAGISVSDGIGYRIIIFFLLYVVTAFYMTFMAKRDEKNCTKKFNVESFTLVSPEEKIADKRKAKMIILLFSIALLGVLIAIAVKPLRNLSMIIMGAAFIIGTVIVGRLLLGSFKKMGKDFLIGMKDVSPSIVIIILAFSVKYIADRGNILHTIFYYFYNLINGTSPYVGVLLLYLFVLIVEFFVPSASAKAVLIIPLLTLAPIPGISVNTIVLTYLFADGYTNVLFPTCGTLLIGLGLADVSYAEWFKKTIVFQFILLLVSIALLMLAVFFGY